MARGRHAKKIDTVHWTYGSFTATSLASSGVVGATVAVAQHLPETLLRIRGEWAGAFAGAQADLRGAVITAGMILVPEGTGATVLWDPVVDGDAPWIWWDVFHLLYNEMVTDVIAAQEAMSARRVIDSKAMRKVRNTELQVVIRNDAVLGTPTVSALGSVRILTGS